MIIFLVNYVDEDGDEYVDSVWDISSWADLRRRKLLDKYHTVWISFYTLNKTP